MPPPVLPWGPGHPSLLWFLLFAQLSSVVLELCRNTKLRPFLGGEEEEEEEEAWSAGLALVLLLIKL
jgi:hypothetical protein